MRKLALVVIVIVVLYFAFKSGDPKPAAHSRSVSSTSETTAETDEVEPADSGSSSWGEGHQAGYDWAEEKGIDDESDCEDAGDHSNSPSFAEGCKAYVQEQQ